MHIIFIRQIILQSCIIKHKLRVLIKSFTLSTALMLNVIQYSLIKTISFRAHYIYVQCGGSVFLANIDNIQSYDVTIIISGFKGTFYDSKQIFKASSEAYKISLNRVAINVTKIKLTAAVAPFSEYNIYVLIVILHLV